MSKLFLALVSGVLALSVAVSIFGLPQPDSAYPPFKRDIVIDQATANAAVLGGDWPLNPRTPAALFVTVPLLAAPGDHLIWTSIVVNVLSMVLLVWGVFYFTTNDAQRLVAAIGLPLTTLFAETVGHTNIFPVFAAALVWGWRFVEERRDFAAGVLVGLTGAVRLWPMALVGLFLLWRRWKLVGTISGTFLVLNVAGLLMPGVTLLSSLESLVDGASTWLDSPVNGSMAAVLESYVPMAPLLGAAVVVVIWIAGYLRLDSPTDQIGWTLAAAMFASPLLWVGYLLVLAPILIRKWWAPITLFFVPSIVVIWTTGILLTIGTLSRWWGGGRTRDLPGGVPEEQPDDHPPTISLRNLPV